MNRRYAIGWTAVLLVGLALEAQGGAPSPRTNVAAGAGYKCVVAPNYWGWKNPRHGDHGQLTDGKTVEDWVSAGKPIYSLPSSAGWNGTAAVIVIDLGRSTSIGGVGLHSVLSPWGPWWPSKIAVLVSDDDKEFRAAGAPITVALKGIEPAVSEVEVKAAVDRDMPRQGYKPTTRWYRSEEFQAQGRYVALLMDPSPETGSIVLDEVEIYAGTADDRAPRRRGATFTEGGGGWKSYRLFEALDGRLSRDLRALTEAVSASSISPDAKATLSRKLRGLDAARQDMPVPASEGFRATLPVNSLHADVFAVQAALWRALEAPPIRVWHSHRWDPHGPLTPPSGAAPDLNIVMARNAFRGDVINLSNSDEGPRTVRVKLSGLPAEHVDLFEVPLVDTEELEPVASALVPLPLKDGACDVRIPAGMTRQVWVRIASNGLAAGKHDGTIRLSADTGTDWSAEVAVSIEVLSPRLPDSFTLYLGGWDYPAAGTYQVTEENLAEYTRLLKEYGVNTTWWAGAMPLGQYDKNGDLVARPTREHVDKWIRTFPDAKMYALTMGFSVAPRDPHRLEKFAAWARDWSEYLRTRGIEPDRISILIRDEPTSVDELKTILEVGRAIKQGEPLFRIWNDIHWSDPSAAPPLLDEVMRDACDIQCFNLVHYLRHRSRHDRWTKAQSRTGLTWWTYTGGTSHRLSDPYSTFLLRSWFCFREGHSGTHWWAFGDGHGGFSWNEYLNRGTTRSPLYLSPDGVTASKSMEAIREGAQDYELLKMLQQRLAIARARGVASPAIDHGVRILDRDVPEVLAAHDVDRMLWKDPKDRSAADRVRVDILRTLSSLADSAP